MGKLGWFMSKKRTATSQPREGEPKKKLTIWAQTSDTWLKEKLATVAQTTDARLRKKFTSLAQVYIYFFSVLFYLNFEETSDAI